MQYLGLEKAAREALLAKPGGMPAFLEAALGTLSAAEAVVPGPTGSFSPRRAVRHLADLEREGYGARIHRLLTEQGSGRSARAIGSGPAAKKAWARSPSATCRR